MALTATTKLRNANKRCLVCDEKIRGFLPAVPIVCPKVRIICSVLCVLLRFFEVSEASRERRWRGFSEAGRHIPLAYWYPT